MAAEHKKAVNIFYSYAHGDEKSQHILDTHLANLK